MEKKIAVARCHEIHLAIKDTEVPRFESIPLIGMAVQLSLHIRGLPLIEFERVKLVASTVLGIPRIAVERIVNLLAEIEFVRLQTEGKRIKALLPTVPYYDDLYDGLGEYMVNEGHIDEFENLTLTILDRLAGAPHNEDSLAGKIGTDRKSFDASIEIGEKGNFLLKRRHRSKSILLNPTYFSENAEIFADHVARSGASTIQKTLKLIQQSQGWPLSLIEQQQRIAGHQISPDDVLLLKRLAQDGMVKPPTITTSHSGESAFIFTPTPAFVNISPLKRDQYEKALAIVSAVRQGQLLPNKYSIRSPGALLYKLKTDLQLKPTTEYGEQYQNLVHLRIAQLIKTAGGYLQLKIIDTPDNREALDVAYKLVQGEQPPELKMDKDAHKAMTGSQEYLESLVSSRNMRKREVIKLSDESDFEMSQLLLGF